MEKKRQSLSYNKIMTILADPLKPLISRSLRKKILVFRNFINNSDPPNGTKSVVMFYENLGAEFIFFQNDLIHG